MPTTGVDFSGVDEFWRMVDVLSKDREPSDSQRHALLTTPGYPLAQLAIGNVTREDLELAFAPWRRAQFDSLTRLSNERASRLKHLSRAGSLRSRLNACRDSLGRVEVVRDALATAAKLLPPGATNRGVPPLVAFALFRDDGYAIGDAILVDLLRACESDLMLFLAHEFHHTYLSRASRPLVPSAAGHAPLRAALEQLRSEGIADLIDKPYPLSSSIRERAAYVTRYNEEYARTPAVLHDLDSLLAIAANDSGQMQAVGQRARVLLWNSGHAHVAYMARQILSVFGTDSLFAGVLNPAAFLRTFASSEEALGRPKRWSSDAMRLIGVLEARYWR